MDGRFVFLREGARGQDHENFGYHIKPLPGRLFPFVLIPVADHWRFGLRYACPSSAGSKGRAVAESMRGGGVGPKA